MVDICYFSLLENIGGHRGNTKEPMSWSIENKKAFMMILYSNVKARNLQFSTFMKHDCGQINQEMIVTTKFNNKVERD